jgi:4'-phosphopantetheinyl transferase EntD
MGSEPGSEAPGRSIAISLTREGWTGRACFVWVRCDFFPKIASDYRRFLHEDEVRCYETLRVERRRLSYLLGRFTARKALMNYSGLALADTQLQILPGVFSQPVARPGLADPVGVSISHSESTAGSLVFPETHPMGSIWKLPTRIGPMS